MGDFGYFIEEGYVVVCGCVKDVIIMVGCNIYLIDIEWVVGCVDGVCLGCVVVVCFDVGYLCEFFVVVVELNVFEDFVEVCCIEY